MKYAVITFGCKVNQYESDAIDVVMRKAGHERCEEEPDVVIVNSCSVTENGDKKARKAVRDAKKRGAVTVLTGCYPQAFPKEAAECGADIIAGTAHRTRLPDIIAAFIAGNESETCLDLPKEYEELPISGSPDRTRAFIKIEDGCDRYCSYCIIPYTRGRVRSRDICSVRRESELCAAAGHKEIVLVGINLSRYGTDIGLDLADAVNAVSEPESVVRVRLSSLEPDLLDDGLIQRLAENKKLCPHFHVSLQSGCDATLKRMNRRYDTAEYLAIIERLRRFFPDCAITTDVMVGFAGETDEEFEQSLAFVRRVGFARIHVFTYSLRTGTAAESLSDFVPANKAAERYARMSVLADEANAEFLRSRVGKSADVLIQKRVSPDYAGGLTPDYTPVRIYGSTAQRHDIISARLTAAGNGYCTGKEIEK